MNFPVTYNGILSKIDSVNVTSYGATRNYLRGDVTGLSPYISRGVISTKQVLDTLLAKGYSTEQSEKLIQELAWREYFQRVWQQLGDDMFDDIRLRYTGIKHRRIPLALVNAATGIAAVDDAIRDLYQTGYMHNHLRMFTASIACNMAKSHWQLPAQWMYYHLLDGDLASNACSWQWVAGSFSSKQYYCNQETINKYSGTRQSNTFLDKGYDELAASTVPGILQDITSPELSTSLPEKKIPVTDPSLPLLIYTTYNLDPLWRKDEKANRILLLEPSHFRQYPVSEKVLSFILELAKNIDGLQVFSGEVNEIPQLSQFPAVYAKEHPASGHLPGKKDAREWLFPGVKGYYPSFFSYWNQCKKELTRFDKSTPVLKRA